MHGEAKPLFALFEFAQRPPPGIPFRHLLQGSFDRGYEPRAIVLEHVIDGTGFERLDRALLRAFPDDRTRFVTTVKNGKNNKMPPWGDILNDDEIGNLWAFISSRRKP